MISLSCLTTTEDGMIFSPVLAALHTAAFTPPARWTEEAFTELFTTPGTQALLASIGEEPVGFILVRSVLDEAEILTLAVSPEWRRRGVAKHLLEHSIHELNRKQIKKLFLEVSTANIAAETLYLETGFIVSGMRKRYYEDGSDAVVMTYEITGNAT